MAIKFAIDAIFRAVDQISSPVKRMSKRVSKSAARMERSLGKVNGAIGKISGGAAGMGKAVAAGAAVAAAGIAHVVNTGAQFEQTLVNAGAKFGEPIDKATAAFKELEDAAIGVSSTTEFSATAAAGAIEFMAKANETAAVTMASLATFADLATSAQVDLATAADIASDAIGPLGLATDDVTKKAAAYTRVADLMAKTTNKANLSFEELFESVKSGAGSFRASGQDVEQFLGATSILAGAGIKGSKAGKDLARAITRFTDAGTKAPGVLKKLDVAVSKDGKIRDFTDIISDLKDKMDTLSEVKQARTLTKIFGANSKAAGVALLANVDKFKQSVEDIRKADGANARIAKKSRDTTLGEIKTFWSTVEAITIDVFGVIKDDVVKVTKAMTKWARANKDTFTKAVLKTLVFFKDNMEEIADKAPKVLAFVAALWAMSKVLVAVEAAMSILAISAGVITTSFAAIAASVLLLVAGLALLIIFWDDIVLAMKPVVAVFDEVVQGMKDGEAEARTLGIIFGALAAPLIIALTPLMLIGRLAKVIVDEWSNTQLFFETMWSDIVDNFTVSIDAITDKIDDAKRAFNELTGTNTFNVSAGGSFTEAVAPRHAVAPTAVNTAKVLGFNRFGPAPGRTDTAGLPSIFQDDPQVVNTTSEAINRSIEETMRNMSIDINLKDPGGAVESVESGSMDESVTVTRTGTL